MAGVGGGGAWATEGSAMARPLLSSDGTVVVPPMEAVWLSGAEWELHGGRGCLSFEVKGGWEERRRGGHAGLPCRWHSMALDGTQSACIPSCAGDNDATVLLKQQSGSRRWQHLAVGSPAGGAAARAAAAAAAGAAAGGAAAGAGGAGAAGAEPAAVGRASPVEQNYTVILGSHRNSCLKFEKDGELCCMVSGGQWTACAACGSHASQLAVVAEVEWLQQLHPVKPALLYHPTRPDLPRPALAPPQVANAPGARLSSNTFRKYWLNYDNGSIRWGYPLENHVGCAG